MIQPLVIKAQVHRKAAIVKGDTVTLGYFTTYDGLPLKMVIDSTGTIDINGQTRIIQYVSCGDGMFIEFGGLVIEGIGNVNSMFPCFDLSMDGPLRCYDDEGLGLFINPYHSDNGWNFQDCEQVITGMSEPGLKTHMKIFPNPANEYVTIEYELMENGSLVLNSIDGKMVFTSELPAGKDQRIVPTQELVPGTYVISLLAGNETIASVKLTIL